MTGFGSRVAALRRPLASAAVAGQRTLMPAVWANQDSSFWEWKGPAPTPPPEGRRTTMGQGAGQRGESFRGGVGGGGEADDDGAGDLPAVVELRGDVDELVEAAGDEVGELHLDHRAVAEDGGADGDADGAALGDRGVEHAMGPAGVEAAGGAEGSLEGADVLA